MINLGFYPGKNMPNVYLEITPVERILEGLAILLTVAAWILAVTFYFNMPYSPNLLFVAPITMTVLVAVFLWASRAPIRFYNFPVKLNEQNYVMQYLIATRFARAVNFLGSLMLLFVLLMDLESMFDVTPGFFQNTMYVTLGFFLLSFIVYYVFAFRYR